MSNDRLRDPLEYLHAPTPGQSGTKCNLNSARHGRRIAPASGGNCEIATGTRLENPGRRDDGAPQPLNGHPALLCPGVGDESALVPSQRRKKLFAAAIVIGSSIILASAQSGCMLGRQRPAATQPATAIDPKQAKPSYWLDQPAVARVRSRSFEALWNGCQVAAQGDGFLIDRRDYREGLLTTLPLASKQVYEFWHDDVVTVHDLAQSSLGMLRRTARFEITRRADGSFEASPKVLVERNSLIERRITSVDQYQNAFSVEAQDVARETERSGNDIPAEYWYPIGRDHALEKQLADSARERLR